MIFRDQIENNREPGDSYAQITAKYGVNRKLIYGWKTDLKKKMVSAVQDGGFSSHEISQMVLKASSLNELELGGFLRSKGITKEQLAQGSGQSRRRQCGQLLSDTFIDSARHP